MQQQPPQQPQMGGVYLPEPPQFTPNPPFGGNPILLLCQDSTYLEISTVRRSEPINEPANSPPAYFPQPTNPYNFFQPPTGQPQAPVNQQPQGYQPYQAPSNPIQQPAAISPPALRTIGKPPPPKSESTRNASQPEPGCNSAAKRY